MDERSLYYINTSLQKLWRLEHLLVTFSTHTQLMIYVKPKIQAMTYKQPQQTAVQSRISHQPLYRQN